MSQASFAVAAPIKRVEVLSTSFNFETFKNDTFKKLFLKEILSAPPINKSEKFVLFRQDNFNMYLNSNFSKETANINPL